MPASRSDEIPSSQAQATRLYLFGRFRLEQNGKPVTLRTRKTESLLAYLTLHPRPHPREYLAALLWGDANDQAARSSLRQELTALRRALGEETLLADRQTVQLNPNYSLWVDVTQFRQLAAPSCNSDDLQTAAALYQGNLLADCYDDWILAERDPLRELYLETLLRLVQIHRSRSDYTQAIRRAQQALEVEPADERAHQHLMVCYVASGDRAAALRQYETCRRSLQEHLDTFPSPETETLHRQIQNIRPKEYSVVAHLTNLPMPTTSFVGREIALEAVESLLQPLEHGIVSARLLTLVGAGGSGKTRLALQSVHELVDAYPDGVWWVELASLAEADSVPQAIAAALGIKETPTDPLETVLLNHLKERQALLVLDNCEHLLETCAKLVEQMLRVCPRVQILTTSREPLQLAGEVIWNVPPLSLPKIGDPHDLAALMQAESTHLFVERSTLARPDFRLSPENAPAVIDICRRLDGLPLAIELAAGRMRTLTCAQIATHLQDRFRLLTSGSRATLPRQQTLRALIDWSYELLSPVERIFFRRLAVFAGSWNLEAAEAVCAAATSQPPEGLEPFQVLDLLSALVNKSLAAAHERGGVMRYTFLETLHEYARERLEEADETDWVRARHLDYYLALAEAGSPTGQAQPAEEQSQVAWMERLRVDQENLRQALEWAIGHDAPRSLQLAGALWPFWEVSGQFMESEDWLQQALDTASEQGQVSNMARSLSRAGGLAWQHGDIHRAEMLHARALALYRQADDRRGIASSLNNLAAQIHAQGDHTRAQALYQESLLIARQSTDPMLISAALNNLGTLAMETQQYPAARQYLGEALQIARQTDNRTRSAIALHNLAETARFQRDYPQALAWYDESCLECQKAGYKLGVAMNTWGRGAMQYLQGDYVTAMATLQESLRLSYELHANDWAMRCLTWSGMALARLSPSVQAAHLLAAADGLRQSPDYLEAGGIDPDEHQRVIELLRTHLGEDIFRQAWVEGHALSLDQAASERS